MPEPFYLVGSTAVGKTELAVRAAELCGAEIVNADAFQVYAGLATLTAKPSANVLSRVRHHLVGHVPLAETYNVARYQTEATAHLQDIAARGRLALVVGGSGLYVKALTHGLSPLPPAQPDLRAKLEDTDLPDLLARLETLDPATAAVIDRHNKRRVLRAVEICVLTGRPFSEQRIAWQEPPGAVRGVFLTREKADIAGRIHRRTAQLLEPASLDEVRQALREAISDTAAGIIGLAEIAALLAGELSQPQCLERIEAATRRYAKRQGTWFRREAFQAVFLPAADDAMEAAARMIAAKITGE